MTRGTNISFHNPEFKKHRLQLETYTQQQVWTKAGNNLEARQNLTKNHHTKAVKSKVIKMMMFLWSACSRSKMSKEIGKEKARRTASETPAAWSGGIGKA